MTAQERLNQAVFYALKEGCFFPVPEPDRDADVQAWIQWGAMRNLHTAIRDFYAASASGAIPPGD